MTVFKNYFKVARNYYKIIVMYTVIFIVISVFMAMSNDQQTSIYTSTKTKISIINHDEDSTFLNGFYSYIEDNAELVALDDNEDALKDALFFRQVDYILIIPKNYTQDFFDGNNPTIETMQVPDSYGTIYSKQLLNRYLNTANIYMKAGFDEETIVEKVKEDLLQHVTVHFENEVDTSSRFKVTNFYNFSNYTLVAIILTVIAMIMVSFQDERIKNRNLVSSFSYKTINRQLLLGNIVLSLGVWAIYVLASVVLYFDEMMSIVGILYMLNSLVLTIFILSFSFFVTTLTSKREVISGISNCVGLGFSFISGAFVPQELLGDFVLSIAKFTPSYYFIKNNNLFTTLFNYSNHNLQPILINMIVILGFAVLFYVLTQIIARRKRKM